LQLTGTTPYELLDNLKNTLVVPEGQEKNYYETDLRNNILLDTKGNPIRGQKMMSIIRNRVIEELSKRFESPNGERAIYAGVDRIQSMFSTTDNMLKTIENFARENPKEYNALVDQLDANNNRKIDKDEIKEFTATVNNMMWADAFQMWESQEKNGKSPHHGNQKEWIEHTMDQKKKLFSAMVNFTLVGMSVYDETQRATAKNDALRPNAQALARLTTGYENLDRAERLSEDITTGQVGRMKDEDKVQFDAYAQTMVHLLNNLNKGEQLKAKDTTKKSIKSKNGGGPYGETLSFIHQYYGRDTVPGESFNIKDEFNARDLRL
jgi:hypothetical protein